MNAECEHCKFRFQREPGYFLGAIYFNYGLTAWIVTVTFFAAYLGWGISPDVQLVPLALFCVVFPLWFFRYARSLWLAFDTYFDRQELVDRSRPPRD